MKVFQPCHDFVYQKFIFPLIQLITPQFKFNGIGWWGGNDFLENKIINYYTLLFSVNSFAGISLDAFFGFEGI